MEERLTVERVIEEYRDDVNQLSKYLSWLGEQSGKKVMGTYSGDGDMKLSMSVPIYDGTLLNFVKTAQKTKFMNRNYAYIYVKYQMRDAQDELRMIQRAMITDMDLLGGILSKYVMRGMTKGTVWQEGVANGILLRVVEKMRELIDFWDKSVK